ncbi:MAG: DUF4336 domain-containing protein [Rhodobacteraceae bacterium]|nr:DUF4336 domain-containing protein [Paracoccaceae bacterium]
MTDPLDLYAPLDEPKPFGDDLWVVDGPVIRMRYGPFKLPFTTRMTVVRLEDGRLWVHSPIRLNETLRSAIDNLGEVAFLVAPNRLHWVYLHHWQLAYPEAQVHAAPGVERHANRGRFRVDEKLGHTPPAGWGDEIGQVLVPGGFMTEAVFFHFASDTVILTDLIENFEAEKIHGSFLRKVMRVGGVVHPHGSTPRDLRLTFLSKRDEVKVAVSRILDWQPKRIVLAHGRLIDADAPQALRAGLAWAGAD